MTIEKALHLQGFFYLSPQPAMLNFFIYFCHYQF